ncbi:MAG: hypothetical protein Kow002_04230 [Anaerolineales bacterium]
MKSDSRIRFGIFMPQLYSWSTMVESAQLVETLGFESFWVADQFVNPYAPARPWFECWTLLAGLATQTSKIRLGPLVTHAVYRNPAILAREAMTLDHISNGRLEIGIGAGGSRADYTMTGIPTREKAEQYERLIKRSRSSGGPAFAQRDHYLFWFVPSN